MRKSDDIPGALAAFERGAKQEYLPCISALGILMVRTAANPDQIRDGMRWFTDAAARGHFFARREVLNLDFENENLLLGKLHIMLK